MKHFSLMITVVAIATFPVIAHAAEDRIELETTRIKANRELPQILYVVPWKDIDSGKGEEQRLVLHNFFGDLYDPVLPTHSQETSETVVNMAE